MLSFNDVKDWLIRSQLVDSHGMEVFAKYFRRLLVGNAPQIFPGIGRNVENPGNYQLLVQEMQKITIDPEQAQKIAETIDTSEGDSFRDFDLSTLMDHFKLDPLSKTLLALAFKQATKADLRTKGTFTVVLSMIPPANRRQRMLFFPVTSRSCFKVSPMLTTTITMFRRP